MTAEHAKAAYAAAAGGPVAEGSVGGGTGMVCHDFKGGIGTASRAAGDVHGRRARAGQPRPPRAVPRQRRAGRAGDRRGRRARHRLHPCRPAAARSSASSRPTPRCCRCSAGGWRSGRRSASPAPAGSARTPAATSSSPSPPATAAWHRIDDDAPTVAEVRTLANNAMNPLFDAVIEADRGGDPQRDPGLADDDRARPHRPRAADRPAAGGAGEVRPTGYSPVSIRRGLSTVQRA